MPPCYQCRLLHHVRLWGTIPRRPDRFSHSTCAATASKLTDTKWKRARGAILTITDELTSQIRKAWTRETGEGSLSAVPYRLRTILTRGTSFQEIPALLNQFKGQNPGSFTAVEVDSEGRFFRAFVSCGVIVQSMAYNQQILGIDCAHTTGADFSGLQMILVGRDGNLSNLVIAVALVDAESIANYEWFFDCVEASGLSIGSRPVFCDRNASMLNIAAARHISIR